MPFFSPEYLIHVFLIFVRVGALLMAAPFFGQKTVPLQVRLLLAILLSYILVGMVPGPPPPYATKTLGLMICVGIEAVTGVLLGFAAQFVFWTIQFAGEILGFQMGLSMAQVFDPINGEPSNPIGQLLSMAFLMTFLLLDGHHQVLRALVASFRVVPLAGAEVVAGGPIMIQWMGGFFSTAMRLASPFMVTFFLVDAALGVFSRVVPQADIFGIGLPLKLFVGVTMTIFFLQNFFPFVPELLSGATDNMYRLIEALVPG